MEKILEFHKKVPGLNYAQKGNEGVVANKKNKRLVVPGGKHR